ncbi:MAG: MaoC/PaaZ C-terminal domain-containing protein [Acidimicrobiales bacterium]
MPLTPAMVGTTAEAVVHEVDSRWLMAYAAGIGRSDACYLDTRREGGVVAHPLFPVCLEWPAVLAMRDRLAEVGLTRDEAARGVHYTHDLVIHRPARPGDRLRTSATLVSVEPHRSGMVAVLRFDTVDDAGHPVATTAMGTLYRDAEPAPPGARADRTATDPRPDADPRLTARVPIAATAAHVYTECARIWNPIHTDPRTARRAGLPGIILHGTATLALAVSEVVDHEAGGLPERVRQVGARFVGMVPLPSEIEVRILDHRPGEVGDAVTFDVRGPDGRPVIADGVVQVAGS